ncbi:MAG: SufE family protein [Alphaproteobacteria bacterium]|nr:MAG: SufE family protein [Alphaproteobacteria bacterium]
MTAASTDTLTTLDEIVDNFSLLEEWDDRYRYVIELGRTLNPLPERQRIDANKVQGCASQVWLATTVHPDGQSGPILTFIGDSDAHIVRGLIAILFAMFSGKRAGDILSTDAIAVFNRLGLREHLTPQRSNGFRSMVERIRMDARAALLARHLLGCFRWSRSNPPKERKRLLGPGDNLPGAFARVIGEGNARERRDCADQRLLASRRRFADDAVLG